MAKFNPQPPIGDKKKLVAWANERKDTGYGLPEREVYLNLAFMLGHQWAEFDVRNRRLANPNMRQTGPTAPVRITINKMGALIERIVSRLTKSAPAPECRPVTDEDDDIGAAKVGSRILQSELNRLHWDATLTRLYFWVAPLGCSYLHLYWDADKGANTGAMDDQGEPMAEGEICMAVVPGTEIKVDPNARSWDDVRWCVRTTGLTKEAIYELYGTTEFDEAVVLRSVDDDMYRLADGQDGGAMAAGRAQKSERFEVNQLWLRPGGRIHKPGLVFTWCGSTVLEQLNEFPYDHGQLPFVPFNMLPGLSRPQGRTWVGDLRGMQRDYNDARSREATIRRTVVPKVFAARGQIDPNRLTSRMEVIEYAPTGPEPKVYLPDNRWMSQYETSMNRADAEMGDRAGQAEVSQGKAPAGAPAAAILALQEADESKLAVSAKELAESIERLGFQTLMIVRQFWMEERIVRTWSEDDRLEVSRFTGSDLPNQLDVHVSSESQLPKSKSARAQLALDLWDRGIMRDPAAFIRMVEVPGTSFLQDQFDRAKRQAEREFSRIMLGEGLVEPQDWHPHATHISQHTTDMMSKDYENADPSIQNAVQQHLRHHMMWLQYQTTGQLPAGLAGGHLPGPAGGGGEQMPEGAGGAGPSYMDPLTGRPPDPLAVASGQSPSGLTMNPPSNMEMGGAVPGQTPDTQAAATGQ